MVECRRHASRQCGSRKHLGNYTPLENGWVAFGDSYAAGIGAATPVKSTDPKDCKQGNGGYPWKLDENLQLLADGGLDFQPLPCSGDVATDITKDSGQLDQWFPAKSDIATLSIIGNDFKFGPIVVPCIVGYIKNAASECEKSLSSAEALLADGDDTIETLLFDVGKALY